MAKGKRKFGPVKGATRGVTRKLVKAKTKKGAALKSPKGRQVYRDKATGRWCSNSEPWDTNKRNEKGKKNIRKTPKGRAVKSVTKGCTKKRPKKR